MNISVKLKERFCKDCKIPINVFEEPYFTERLYLYDKIYDTLNKWETFVSELSKYANEQDYFEEYNKVKDAAINDIKNSEAYQRFNNDDMNKFAVTHKNMPGKDIFKPSFDDRYFVSIDIKKANFSCLRNYSADIFEGANTWEEFIGRYTSNRHIIDSKYIRQVILGNCNPKRHITYEKYLMDKVLTKITQGTVDISDIVFFSNDEIVIGLDADYANHDTAYSLTHKLKELMRGWEIPLRIAAFKLHKIQGVDSYYKKYISGEIEFKCIDSFTLPFVLRKLYNMEVTEGDKVFFYQGLKSKVLEVPAITL